MNAAPDFSVTLQRFIAGQRAFGPDLSRIRAQRVRGLVRHVSEHVSLYRNLYRRHNVDIANIRAPADLWRLPAVSKVDYLEAGSKGYTDGRGDLLNLYTQTTSGSLGRALTIYATATEADRLLANLWTGWLGLGVHERDRLFMMSAPYLAEEVAPFRSVFIPVQMKIEEAVALFRRFRPTVIVGMVEAIALLAVELKRRNVQERHEVRAIFPFGQTYSEQLRGMISNGFGAEVFVLYGSAEAGWLGYECEYHAGLHVPEGRIDVQVARMGKTDEAAAPRELGEVIITSLLRSTTPFVRYRLHDAAALDLDPCPCGRTAPRIVQIEGRVQDFLVALEGTWIGPSGIAIDLMVGRPVIIDYRIVQTDREHVIVSLVVNPELPALEPRDVREVVRRHLGPVQVEVDLVKDIPRDPSGKRRRVFRMFDLPDALA
jgi:phenylacetate-CoA ligase